MYRRSAPSPATLDIHDLALDGGGGLVFVNTLFSCLARSSDTHSFTPLWKPPFISKLAAEDRCHLNGLAMKDGKPAYVTAVSESDVADGWRDRRVDGGCVIDVQANEVVLRGLSMPHSPRWYRDRLWLHNSGTGEFGTVDLEAGRFEPVCFCPGYLRGLDFIGDFAVVGTSLARDNKTFQGLPLDDALSAKGATPRCSLQVIDLRDRRRAALAQDRGRGAGSLRRVGPARLPAAHGDRLPERRDPPGHLGRRGGELTSSVDRL